jgi:hypothetical protein
MNPRYSIVMWRKPCDMTEIQMTDISFSLLKTLDSYGFGLSPTYLTVSNLSDMKTFELSHDNLARLFKTCMNSENGRDYPELGRTISFFSSLDDNTCSGISLHLGGSNTLSPNSLVLNLPKNQDWFFTNKINFYNLFEKLISIFVPYYAFVAENTDKRSYWNKEKDIPTIIHWLNYFDYGLAKKLKVSQFKGVREISYGYIFKLFDVPFDSSNFAHIREQQYFSNLLVTL